MRADVHDVSRFLFVYLNRRVPAKTWAASLLPDWAIDSPNHGFLLSVGEQVVGVQLAFYAERMIGRSLERFCNIASWCVLPEYRAHGLRLLNAVLAQPGYTFTDLSPSGSVIALNERLKFQHLDTSASLNVNLPWPTWPRDIRIVEDRALIEATIGSQDLRIYRDHLRALAARHLLITRGGEKLLRNLSEDQPQKNAYVCFHPVCEQPRSFPQSCSRRIFSLADTASYGRYDTRTPRCELHAEICTMSSLSAP